MICTSPKSLCAVLVLGIAVAWAGPAASSARETRRAQEPQNTVRLDLGFDNTTPGGEVLVPIMLDAPTSVEVGRTVNEVTFPNGVVSFEQVKPGIAAEVAEAVIEADLQPHPERADMSTVRVTVTSGRDGISSGLLAFLVFRVSKDALADAPANVIALGNVPRAFTVGRESRALGPVDGKDGEITVTVAPLISCFFYMH